MRDLLVIAAAVVLFGAVGCASEEENRREKLADQKQMWGGDTAYMPDRILEMGEYAPQTPTAPKTQTASKTPTATPAATPTPAVVQVSGQTPQ
jgi:hypothetical protein